MCIRDRFMDWMSSKEGNKTQHASVQTNFVQYENGEIATRIQLIPSTGTHYITYKGNYIKVERSREKNVVDMTTGSLWETVTLTTFGRDRKIFMDLLEEAKDEVIRREEGSTVIYHSSGGDWRRFGPARKKRPIQSVILDQGQKERILGDAKHFLSMAKWYTERGIPYRRGYLLHGPPGCGKSSFITALAASLSLNICILNLHAKGITDDSLNLLLHNAPQRSIILLEDIDAAVDYPKTTHVTESGLLNALDGVAASEGGGRLLFMTTNHLEKLSPTLIRPGRVDIKEYFGLATHSQLKHMYLRFFPDQSQLSNTFADKVPPGTASMAQLQSYFMAYKDQPTEAAQNIEQIQSVDNKALSER
eukprot:TRINITY_DN2202_c0_g1_i1.p1 TRINITY_DN2202_c0_g1~~TRINITY_DN2202_c0_g1_i1.p1  ORF type:complete len:362 (+),score=77.31 TRINITY_DN2202_c0_g1_i1:64-1149(+)